MQSQSNQFQIQNRISQHQGHSEATQTSPSFSPPNKHWCYKHRKTIYTEVQDVKRKKKYNALHWNKEENQKYAQFLCNFIDLAKSSIKQKRKYHLNRMLSKHIRTRSPTQCRSHHQKMLRSFGSLQGIIAKLTNQENQLSDKSTQSTDQNSTQNILTLESGEQSQSLQQNSQVRLDGFKQNQALKLIIRDDDGERDLWDILCSQNYNEQWIIQ